MLLASTLMCAVLAAFGPDPVSLASHDGTVSGDTLRWESRVLTFPTPSQATVLELHNPLPQEWVDAAPPNSHWVFSQGRAVALGLDAEATSPSWRGTLVVMHTHQPILAAGEEWALSPPLMKSNAVQRIEVGAGGGLLFRAAERGDLVRHMRFLTSPSVDTAARHLVDEDLPRRRGHVESPPIYLRVSDLGPGAGVAGTLSTLDARRWVGALVCGALAVGLLVMVVWAQRRWRAAAELAHAERVIAGEADI